jgi:hypothetical protein
MTDRANSETGRDANKALSIIGQKYAYATASLVLGITCFVGFIGLEKAVLAVVFGWLALKSTPSPALQERRGWAKAGIILGSLILVVVPTLLLLNIDRIKEFIEALEKLNTGR